MIVFRRITNRINKSFLLLYCKSMTYAFVLPTILFNLSHYTIRRILSDNIVSDCHIKYRMNYRVDVIQGIHRNILVIQQMIIEHLHICIFDIRNQSVTEFISNESVIHIDVIASGGLTQIVLGTHISIECHVNCCSSTHIEIQSIHLTSNQILFFLSKCK